MYIMSLANGPARWKSGARTSGFAALSRSRARRSRIACRISFLDGEGGQFERLGRGFPFN